MNIIFEFTVRYFRATAEIDGIFVLYESLINCYTGHTLKLLLASHWVTIIIYESLY